MWRFRYFYVGLLTILWGCSDDASEPNKPSHEYLISATPTQEYSIETFQFLGNLLGIDEFTDLVQYDVQAYKIVYATTYQGEKIEASGIVYVPNGLTVAAPLLSLHHGTTLDKGDAPSVTGDFSGFEFFGSAGYITIVPDFIGYGESSSIFHPFYDEQHSASAVIDMIKATKEFLTEEDILFNEKLFLAGYSEGGFVTLAAAKSVEADPIPDLNIVAVAAGAGGYDLENLLDDIMAPEEYVYPSYFAFLIMAYNETNDWGQPLTEFFNEPYAAALATYMNGEYSGEFINGKLTNDLSELLTEDFYEALKDPETESTFVQALRENSVHGWDTDLPIRLYHGQQDEIIPFENSVMTLQNFEDSGSENVSLTIFPVGDHVQSLTPTLVDVILWFEELK